MATATEITPFAAISAALVHGGAVGGKHHVPVQDQAAHPLPPDPGRPVRRQTDDLAIFLHDAAGHAFSSAKRRCS
jgi:hypothetical protein